jgi:putative transposase
MHVCFKVKYCHEIFFREVPGVQERCEEIFREVEANHGFRLHEIGFDSNHVHLSVDLGVRYSIADVAKLLKGTSGHKLLEEFPQMKREYFWGSGLWGSQVYFDSTGRDAGDMRDYVRNQVGSRRQCILKGQAKITQYT